MNKLTLWMGAILLLPLLWTCEGGSALDGGSGAEGQGGSLARFAVKGDFLYTVDFESMSVFDIADPEQPKRLSNQYVDFGIETIFPYKDKLYLGSQFGMFTYSVAEPDSPQFISFYSHIYSCDPVVVDDEYAYVTLSTESGCGRDANELHIIDITEAERPREVAIYDMYNPKGLGVTGDTLFICDDGLKVYDVSNPSSIQLIERFDIPALDVIPYQGRLFVIGPEGLYQYRITADGLRLLSKLPIDNPDDEVYQ